MYVVLSELQIYSDSILLKLLNILTEKYSFACKRQFVSQCKQQLWGFFLQLFCWKMEKFTHLAQTATDNSV